MADETTDLPMASTLTTRDVEILISAVRCLKHDPIEVDYTKLAAEIGAKNNASATTSWNKVRGKLVGKKAPKAPNSGGSTSTKVKTPRKSADASNMKTAKAQQTGLSSCSNIKANGTSKDRQADTSAADVQLNGKSASIAENSDDQAAMDEKADVEMTTASTANSDVDVPETPAADSSDVDVSSPKKVAATKNAPIPATPKIVDQEEELMGPETPAPTKPRKRGRKSKAEKEAEAMANGEAADADGDEGTPAKKARKTPTKKSKDTPTTPRKPRTKKTVKTEDGSDGEADGETLELAAKAKQAAEVAEANDVLNGNKTVGSSSKDHISGVASIKAAPEEDEGDMIEITTDTVNDA